MPVETAVVVGATIVGVAELIKLGNTGLQLYMQAMALAGQDAAQVEANFQKALAEYEALPLPMDIPEPE